MSNVGKSSSNLHVRFYSDLKKNALCVHYEDIDCNSLQRNNRYFEGTSYEINNYTAWKCSNFLIATEDGTYNYCWVLK